MLKQLIQRGLGKAGYQLQRLREPDPPRKHIDVFALCMRELLTEITSPFVLQIGANDGIHADPVRSFLLEKRLPALLVEPHPTIFPLLQKNYSGLSEIKFANVAISEGTDGSISLFTPDDKLLAASPKLSGLCSLSRAQLLKEFAKEKIVDPELHIKELRVPSLSVRSLMNEYQIKKVDVLQIDTEGYDWKVLSQFDLAALSVRIINMEFFHLRNDERVACLAHLTSLGYETALRLGDLVAYKPLRLACG